MAAFVRPLNVSSVLLILIAGVAFAQPAATPAFEVASIRPHDGPLHRILGYDVSGPRLTLEGYPINGLIREAYNLEFYQIVIPPSVAQQEIYYDVVAKAPGAVAPTRNEFRAMLQALLAERFHLQFHREPKEMPVYSLVVAKGGPKFKASEPEAISGAHIGVNGRNQFLAATRYTMPQLALGLRDAIGVDRPVLDKTGLTGEYDFRIEATLLSRGRTPEFGDLSVFTAVQDQLGLRLVPDKAKLEVLVVDRIEKPSAN